MKKIYSITLLISLVLSFGCKKDNDANPATCDQITARGQAYSNAVTTFTNAPTKANCDVVKTTGNSYIDAIAACPTATTVDIVKLRADFNAIVCPQ